ncbi:MAG: hypothetical protein H6557_07325 [Lewinellaceae bacterium]|nr:hypothetical protein [Phaeodactylibacter sp.]MCB9036413.1 hypothetical protein [Lewinellaceae bacterium]
MSSFKVQQSLLLTINGIKKIHLSLSQYGKLKPKDLLTTEHTTAGRLKPEQHVDNLIKAGELADPTSPLLAISCRNILSNLRCIAYKSTAQDGQIASVEEEVFSPHRPYFVFGEKDGRLQMTTFTPETGQEKTFEWFFSGVPVVWENMNEEALFKKIVTEAADHSHVWRLPRGAHPKATENTQQNWEALHGLFIRSIGQPSETAFGHLAKYAAAQHLKREDDYLHNILGLNEAGHLIQYCGKGKLEDLGRHLLSHGVKSAIMVDNSGSVTTIFFPKGAQTENPIQLFAAPNHRHAGTAYLIVELLDAAFQ